MLLHLCLRSWLCEWTKEPSGFLVNHWIPHELGVAFANCHSWLGSHEVHAQPWFWGWTKKLSTTSSCCSWHHAARTWPRRPPGWRTREGRSEWEPTKILRRRENSAYVPNSQPRISTWVCQGCIVITDLPTLGTNPKQYQSESETQGAKDLAALRNASQTICDF
jgi:hypothetical protein